MKTVHRDVPISFNGTIIGRGDVFVTHSPKGVEVTMDAEIDDETIRALIARGPFDDDLEACSICGGDPMLSEPCVNLGSESDADT